MDGIGAALPAALRRSVERFLAAWRRTGLARRLMLALGSLAGVALVGAFLFGAWHVLFGGLVKGNPRAAAFGTGLAAVSGLAIVMLWLVARRAMPLIEEAAD